MNIFIFTENAFGKLCSRIFNFLNASKFSHSTVDGLYLVVCSFWLLNNAENILVSGAHVQIFMLGVHPIVEL